MANPKLKNGHTRIANEILEQIMKLALNGTQFRIVMSIWRFTYGFQQKENKLSVSFLAEKINASRSQVERELKVLIDKKIIFAKDQGPRKARIIGFNKNYEEWGEVESARKGTSPVLTKKSKTSLVKKKKYDEENTYYKMAKYFHDLVAEVARDAGVEHLIRKANLQTWADDFRKLVELDKVEDKKLIFAVMQWVTKDDFWRTNVLSAKKFREKFAELALKMNESSKFKQVVKADPRDKEIEFQQWIANGGDPDEFDWGK